MTKSKKAIFGMLSMLLVAAVAVAGVVMWLTAQTDVVNNTFTVGNITATLDEAEVDEYGVLVDGAARVTENEYKLVPGHTYVKDPTVHIGANSEDAYLFVKVTNDLVNIEGENTIAAQMAAKGWTAVDGYEGLYIFGSIDDGTVVKAGENHVVFEELTIASNAVLTEALEDAVIDVQACAVQVDGLDEKAAAKEAAGKLGYTVSA